MWIKIKTEIVYYKYLIIILYLCDATALYYNILWKMGYGFLNTAALISILTVTALIFMIFFFVSWINTKRERYYISKPGFLSDTGIVRLILPFVFWIIPSLIAAVFELTLNFRNDENLIIYMISVTGILLLINSNLYIIKDSAYTFKRKYMKFGIYNDQAPSLLYLILITIVLFIAVNIGININPSNPIDALFDPLFSGYLPVILMVSGIIFTYISIRVYQKRLEFLD
jgi:hypothetical protein